MQIPTLLNSDILKCCFTGYRPSKFPFSLGKDDKQYKRFENALIEEILGLIQENCRVFYSGMAMGFDIIAAETVLLLKKAYSDPPIKLISVLPFEGQGDSYTEHWRKRFYNVLDLCDEKIILSKNYFSGCYQKRNKYMVDNSDCVLTWYDGRSGGTRNTLDYATSKGRFIINVNKISTEDFAVQTGFELY